MTQAGARGQFDQRYSDNNQKRGGASGSRCRGGRKTFDKSNIQCYNCQKWGHLADECYSNNKTKPRGDEAQLAQEEESVSY